MESLLQQSRGNGYMQCYNDMLLAMIEHVASNPSSKSSMEAVMEKMSVQKEIRESTGWSHPEEIVKGDV